MLIHLLSYPHRGRGRVSASIGEDALCFVSFIHTTSPNSGQSTSLLRSALRYLHLISSDCCFSLCSIVRRQNIQSCLLPASRFQVVMTYYTSYESEKSLRLSIKIIFRTLSLEPSGMALDILEYFHRRFFIKGKFFIYLRYRLSD